MADWVSKNEEPEPLDMLLSDFLKSASSHSGDLKSEMIERLVKDVSQLQQKVKEQKEWAQRVVTEAATRVSKDHMELQALRMEKADYKMIRGHTPLLADEEYFNQLTSNAWAEVNASISSLQTQNAQLKSDIEAYKLSNSEYHRSLQEVKKRGKKLMKKLVDAERQANAMRSQYEKEQLRMMQMEQDLARAHNQADQTQVTWRNEGKKKEHANGLVAKETKKLEAKKSKTRAHLLKLQRRGEAERQLPEEECRRLEDELGRLHMSTQLKYSHLDFDEGTSSGLRANSRWICVVCMQNEVSVVFLPCSHHVLCFPCLHRKSSSDCPSCHAEIKQVIKVYGRGS